MSRLSTVGRLAWCGSVMLALTGAADPKAPAPASTAPAKNSVAAGTPEVSNAAANSTAAPAVTPAPPANLFPAQTWQPPPPPPPVVKPAAPPLPFKFAGSLQEANGETVVFLSHSNRQIIAKAGDLIDSTYSVDAVTATEVEFTYLPLREKQRLQTGNKP